MRIVRGLTTCLTFVLLMIGSLTVKSQESAQMGTPLSLLVGKSSLLRLDSAIERVSVGNPAVADVTLISPRELYLLGKTFGSTNLILWRKSGPTTLMDVSVNLDTGALLERLRRLLPGEDGIDVHSAADSIVLSGTVSSAMRAEQAVSIAEAHVRVLGRALSLPVTAGDARANPGQAVPIAFGGGGGAAGDGALKPRVVNLMEVAQAQQVMLEVKVAEISKSLLDQLGVGINGTRSPGDWRYSIVSRFLTESAGTLGIRTPNGSTVTIDAEKSDGLIKVLAEPNIVSISGQEASFLAGGKIFIPVSRANAATGAVSVTLEEKEFGIGLRFTPTVLDGGRIHLRVAPEVSELSQSGSPFVSAGGATAILPSFTTRRAQTTVQLSDGQSLAIAGLIRNNVSSSVKRLPWLGELPILGALFRSAEFQSDQSELMFVVTPRLVKPLATPPPLPTDAYLAPNRGELYLEGRLEGSGRAGVPSDSQPATGQASRAEGPAATEGVSHGGFRID
jgi:pilus assembly protein CpaC